MSKEFDSIVNDYLIKLKGKIVDDIGSGQYTKELSYHTVIDTFFIDIIEFINKPISGIHEPKKQSQVGHPDWRFHHPVNFGVHCFFILVYYGILCYKSYSTIFRGVVCN